MTSFFKNSFLPNKSLCKYVKQSRTFAFEYNSQCHCLLLHGIDQFCLHTGDFVQPSLDKCISYWESLSSTAFGNFKSFQNQGISKSINIMNAQFIKEYYPFNCRIWWLQNAINHVYTGSNKTQQKHFSKEFAFAWDMCSTNMHTSGLVQHKFRLV